MSFNGNGTFVINSAGQPVVSNTVISSTAFNALTADLANGLSMCITKDGQTTPTADIPMGSNKITGLANGTAAGDAANLGQVQSTVAKLLGSVSGADTITAIGSPTVAAYAAGQMFYFVAAGANTGAVTINIDSLGAKNITRDGTTALAAGDIQSGEVCVIVYDGTQFQLVNGASQSAAIVTNSLTVNGTSSLDGAVTINDSGADVDFRVEGDTDSNLLFVDASEDNIGIGTNSTDTTYRLTVQGVGTSGNPMGGICFRQGATDTLYVGSIATDNDTDVEIYNPRNGYIRFATNNLVHMLLDASGNLGLGATSGFFTQSGYQSFNINGSTSGLINIKSNGTDNFWLFSDGSNQFLDARVGGLIFRTNGGSERMRLDSAGNVGIGTTSPSEKLEVAGAVKLTAGNLSVAPSTTTNAAVTICTNAGGTFFAGLDSSTGGTFGVGNYSSVVYNGANTPMVFFTNATERMRLDASGNLGVGTSSPAYRLDVAGPAGSPITLNLTSANSNCDITMAASGSSAVRIRNNVNDFQFHTNGAERARITGGGNLLLNTTAYTDGCLVAVRNGNNNTIYAISDANNTTESYFRGYSTSSSATTVLIYSNGNLVNTNGSYGTISDAKMKTDIVDAGSQWADMKAVRFRKFKMKDDPAGIMQLGVVAQELEQTSPGLIEENVDRDAEGNDLGTTTKSVKTSVLLMKAAVALQEAMTRIEELEAKVAALEAK